MSDPQAGQCPVDHTTRSKWTNLSPTSSPSSPPSECSSASASSVPTPSASTLPTERETSSIPRTTSENWVYPSEAQFFAAMERKQHSPRASDMRVIVPIHNAVNEHAWGAVREWEKGRGCANLRLVSFKGRPKARSPKAWAKVLLGYSPPFDRHDWIVDRCGVRLRYVIDFYTGRSDPATPQNPSFYIDARPALDNWEGVKMRTERFWERWMGRLWSTSDKKSPMLESKNGP